MLQKTNPAHEESFDSSNSQRNLQEDMDARVAKSKLELEEMVKKMRQEMHQKEKIK